jgi:hypothetical protein
MGKALLILLLLLPCACTVIGYEPTPEELEALRRGENPRAGERERRAAEREAQQNSEAHPHTPTEPEPTPMQGPPGPDEGVVLRWVDSATVVIEADNRRETVALPGERRRADTSEERRILDRRMEQFTYGTHVRLEYTQFDDDGEIVYRDTEGRLVAAIHRQGN